MLGQDYMTARDQLIDACAKAGAGLLIHPYLGRLTVICTGCRVSERVEEGGLARIHLSFVDSGENTYPSAANDTGRIVDLRATDALSAAETSFASTFDVVACRRSFQDRPKRLRAARLRCSRPPPVGASAAPSPHPSAHSTPISAH